jgi:hypothetical protein
MPSSSLVASGHSVTQLLWGAICHLRYPPPTFNQCATLLLEVNQQNVLQVEVSFIESYLVMREQGTKNTFTSSGYKVLVNYSQRD